MNTNLSIEVASHNKCSQQLVQRWNPTPHSERLINFDITTLWTDYDCKFNTSIQTDDFPKNSFPVNLRITIKLFMQLLILVESFVSFY